MYPILFQWGPLSLRTYGAMVALAFLTALLIAKRTAALRRGISEPFLMDLAVVVLLCGILGARLFYVVLNFSYFAAHPDEILKIWEGGLVFYGGFLAALAGGYVFVRRKGVPFGRVADCVAPALAVGQAIGRWGCFFAGCCYGSPTSVPWAISFKDPAALAPLNVDLHPVQLYESLGALVIAVVLGYRLSRKKETQGEIFWLYVVLYGALRFVLEFYRGDDRGAAIGGLFPSQIIALGAILLGVSLLMAHHSGGKTPGHHGPVISNHH